MSTFKYVIIRKLECMIIKSAYNLDNFGKYLHIVLNKPSVETAKLVLNLLFVGGCLRGRRDSPSH